ncbi:ATP-binding cassette, subfamily C, LapB [Desulfonatronum thiosulfatophilum]|uniref:ATP-binding cassette, subfamily C, LapB n=1 Tax=Desulfonatronum thiosulfatophilum TaxID=617002 RepID=A0A1G6CMH5_9BACT|nr:type I secretion system permease/ATPase [Desulfonatronum thiosulfatophilum]SDB34054.1 ATP-binding cassette, subfamily C, LapB [Desulfonatronum thiosulfatophilum]
MSVAETHDQAVLEGWKLEGDIDNNDDPLLDCLIQLTRLHGLPTSRTGLVSGLPLVKNRLTVELFSRAADRADLSSRVVKKKLRKISPLQLPAVLLLHARQACVLVGVESGGASFRILLPETGMGEKTVTREELEQLYTGYAIFARPKYHLERKSLEELSPGVGISWFWGTFFKHWRIYRDVMVASFLINVFGLMTPFFVLLVYDRVIPNHAVETLWVLAIGITVIYFFALVMRLLRSHFIDEAGNKANLKISSVLLQKVLDLKMEARPKSMGSFSRNIQEFESIRDFITSFSITSIIDLPFMMLALLVVWYIGGDIVIIFGVAIFILAVHAWAIQRPLRNAVSKTLKASSQKNAILVEGISGLETIKTLGAESQMQRAWEESVSYISKWSSRARALTNSVNDAAFFWQSVVVVGVVVAGVYKIPAGELSQGGLIALVILSRQALAPMGQVVRLATRYQRAKEALKTLNDIMKLPVERPADKVFLHRTRFEGAIGIKNLTFAYPGQTAKVFNNISLEVRTGEKVGVIGPIGSGKTTLGKIMLGLYEPQSGMVTMDGTDIRQIDPTELRRFIGYVPQDIQLFRGTVRNNITMGTYDVDDMTILQASMDAGVDDFVKKHPLGYDMEIGELGRGLSGGQRQCIVLARALLLDPPVLVLDEPTSNMDNRTEIRIRKRLATLIKNKTLILITHRASLLDMVDRLVVIDNGTIVADGPKASVMEAMKKGQLRM